MSDTDGGAEFRVYEKVFRGLTQLGPGSREATLSVLDSVRDRLPAAPAVADMGCGVGASTLVLAEALPGATITAVDVYEPFLATLRELARLANVAERVTVRAGDMADPDALEFATGSFDLIWSEAAAYAIGVDRALALWPALLRSGGVLVFSELVWVAPEGKRPRAAVALWQREYPAMRTGAEVESAVVAAGLTVLGRKAIPRAGWEAYYGPLRERVAAMRADAAPGSVEAELLAGMQQEIDVFDEYGETFAYEFFAAVREAG